MVKKSDHIKTTSVRIEFTDLKKTIELGNHASILEAALTEDIDIFHSCGGHASCGTCLVVVDSGLEHLPPRNNLEAEMAEDRGFLPAERLACQTCPRASLQLHRALSDKNDL